MTKKVAIIGGGIAGLATAGGLSKLGWDVTVYEQSRSFRPIGAGIALAPNAVRALEWLGLGEVLRSRAIAHGSVAIRDTSGRWLLRSPIEDIERRFGVPSFALHRSNLHSILADHAANADLRLDHRVTGVRDGTRPVVTFESPDGPSVDDADLVVGADGAGSCIRQAMFRDHPGLAYAGYVAWRGLTAADAAPPASREMGSTETWGRGKRFGNVPLSDGQVYWYATVSAPLGAHSGDTLDDLRDRYRDWHDPIPSLLDAASPRTLLRHDIRYLKTPLPGYSAGRIVLLGDAAHAMTPDIGQGACLALEDAVTLISAIARNDDVPRALRTYDRARRARTQHVVRASARWGRIAEWRSPVAVAMRDALLSLVPSRLFVRASQGTLGWTPPPGV